MGKRAQTRRKSKGSSRLESDAAFQLATARAAAVAANSFRLRVKAEQNSMSTMGKFIRKEVELQMFVRKAQLKFMDALEKMKRDSKISTLFALFDINGSGRLDCCEFALTLRKMSKSDRDFQESLNIATVTIAAFDEDNDMKLDEGEFAKFLLSMGCTEDEYGQATLNDIVQSMALKATFPEDGEESILKQVMDMVESGVMEETEQMPNTNLATEARLLLLFQMFDFYQDGVIKFQDVSFQIQRYLSTLTIDKSAEGAMKSLLRASGGRRLTFPQFMYLLLNLQTSSNGAFNLFKLADDLTLRLCKHIQKNGSPATLIVAKDGDDLSADDIMFSTALEMTDLSFSSSGDIPEVIVDPYEKARLKDLFNLWDLDGDGYVDLHELVLGLRKFHEAKDLNKSVEDGVSLVMQADDNNDGRLDKEEFYSLMYRWALSMNADLVELADFMVVRTTLRDNADEEVQYLQSVRGLAPVEMTRRQSTPETSMIFGFLKTLQCEILDE